MQSQNASLERIHSSVVWAAVFAAAALAAPIRSGQLLTSIADTAAAVKQDVWAEGVAALNIKRTGVKVGADLLSTVLNFLNQSGTSKKIEVQFGEQIRKSLVQNYGQGVLIAMPVFSPPSGTGPDIYGDPFVEGAGSSPGEVHAKYLDTPVIKPANPGPSAPSRYWVWFSLTGAGASGEAAPLSPARYRTIISEGIDKHLEELGAEVSSARLNLSVMTLLTGKYEAEQMEKAKGK